MLKKMRFVGIILLSSLGRQTKVTYFFAIKCKLMYLILIKYNNDMFILSIVYLHVVYLDVAWCILLISCQSSYASGESLRASQREKKSQW